MSVPKKMAQSLSGGHIGPHPTAITGTLTMTRTKRAPARGAPTLLVFSGEQTSPLQQNSSDAIHCVPTSNNDDKNVNGDYNVARRVHPLRVPENV